MNIIFVFVTYSKQEWSAKNLVLWNLLAIAQIYFCWNKEIGGHLLGKFVKRHKKNNNMAPFSTISTHISFNTAWLSFQEFFFHFTTYDPNWFNVNLIRLTDNSVHNWDGIELLCPGGPSSHLWSWCDELWWFT